jgi:hypothetical protein
VTYTRLLERPDHRLDRDMVIRSIKSRETGPLITKASVGKSWQRLITDVLCVRSAGPWSAPVFAIIPAAHDGWVSDRVDQALCCQVPAKVFLPVFLKKVVK